jgi:two-component system C4-dicarboxylate transport sensor histidine kinase DctB
VPPASAELLVAANRASGIEAVMRWMLHDLRNPIQTLAFLPALAEADADQGSAPDWQEVLSIATAQLTAGLALLDRLVSGSAGPATPEPVALAEVLGFLADLFRARRGPFQVTMPRASLEALPAVAAVRGDVELALLNLLLNAAEASGNRAGGVTVLVRSDGAGVELVLEDDGPGIPEDLRARLFEPSLTTRADPPGRGLGLFVAHHLLTRSGGELRYEPGNPGSRFIARLPLWRAEPEQYGVLHPGAGISNPGKAPAPPSDASAPAV